MKTRNKAVGFYAALCTCVLAIVSSVCYGVLFRGIEYKEPVFNVQICILLAVSGVAAAALLFVSAKTAAFAPVLLCLGSGVSLLMFIKMIIWPVADTVYGIEPFPQFTQLVLCAVLILVTFLFSEVALYMKKDKEEA